MWRSILLVAVTLMTSTVVANPVSRQVGYTEDIKVAVKNNNEDVQQTIAELQEETTDAPLGAAEAVEDEAGAAVDETVTIIPDTDAASEDEGAAAAAGAQVKTAPEGEEASSVSEPPSTNDTLVDAGPETVKRTNGDAGGEAASPLQEDAVEDTTIEALETSTIMPAGGEGEEQETVDASDGTVVEASVSDTLGDTDTSGSQAEVTDPDAKPATNDSSAGVNTKSNEDTTDAPAEAVGGDASDAGTPAAQEDAQTDATGSLVTAIRTDGNASEPTTEEKVVSPQVEASEAAEEDPSQGVTDPTLRASEDVPEDEPETVTVIFRETIEDTTDISTADGEGEGQIPAEVAVIKAADEEATITPLLEAQESILDETTDANVAATDEQTDAPVEETVPLEEDNATDEAAELPADQQAQVQVMAEQNTRVNEDTTEQSAMEDSQVIEEASVADPGSATVLPPEEEVEANVATTGKPSADGEGELVEASVVESTTQADTDATAEEDTPQKRTAGSAGLVKVSVNGQTYHEVPSAQQVSSADKGEGNPGNDYRLKVDPKTPEQEAEEGEDGENPVGKEFEKVAEKYGLRPASNAQALPAEKEYASEQEAARFPGDHF
ncbi:uncharacterized protein [Panulirus ornatus]|uniref:uncharacterized protein n=1 Tax=Panulirus ornatus TaxID=150431 RepID=UPI003A893D26